MALQPLLEGLARAFGFTRVVAALHDQDHDTLRGAVSFGVPAEIAEGIEVSLAQNPLDPLVLAFQRGSPVRVAHGAADHQLRTGTTAALAEMGIRSFVAIPLRAADGNASDHAPAPSHAGSLPATAHAPRTVGVLILGRDAPITSEEIERVMPFATQAGTTLARASDVQRERDTTERHAVEKEWLWWMVNAVADPVVLTNADNDIVLHNMRAERLFRAAPGDSPGKKHAISMNNFLFTAALSAFNLEAPAERGSRELTLVDPIEGTELLFEMIATPATNYRDGTRGTVCVLKDVSELRHAAEQLGQNVQRLQSAGEEIRVERDRLHLLLRSVPNPIIMLDNDNEIIVMNEQARRLFEAQPAAGSPRRRRQVCLGNATRFASFVSQLRLDTSPVKHGELVLTDPDSDEPMTMVATSTVVQDELGAAIATVSVLQDVSRLRELERRRVEQMLFESEKLAATGRLAASIAHEINNPLEAIKNSLYLLSRSVPEGDEHRRFVEIAVKETGRVSRILRQMLGFYRPAKMEAVDVNELVREAEALLEKHLLRHNVRFENDLARERPQVVASPDQIKQVLLNLVLNAQEAMPDGGTIYISTRVAREADPQFIRSGAVQIQIRDSGRGIAEQHLPHIFEPFFTTQQGHKGTGLGLWVSYGIVQQHGGTIKVRSRVGRGTTFTVVLPIGGPAADA